MIHFPGLYFKWNELSGDNIDKGSKNTFRCQRLTLIILESYSAIHIQLLLKITTFAHLLKSLQALLELRPNQTWINWNTTNMAGNRHGDVFANK